MNRASNEPSDSRAPPSLCRAGLKATTSLPLSKEELLLLLLPDPPPDPRRVKASGAYFPHMGGGNGACGSSITLGGCLQLGEKVVDTSGSDWYSTAASITLSQSAAV